MAAGIYSGGLHVTELTVRGSRRLRAACRVIVLGALGGPLVAVAQSDPAGPTRPRSELAEVVVTAQKVEQNLQEVPVAVTAIGADEVAANRITNLADVGNLVPNVDIQNQTYGGLGGPNITIRGVVSGFAGPTNDPANALYVDGVYLGRSEMQGVNTADIERVEVLRGPQGVLYGKNSTGGAINFITQAPSGTFGFKQDVGVSNFDGLRARTRVDLPEWNGLSARITYLRDQRDGAVRNIGAGTVWKVGNSLKRDVVSPRTLGGWKFDNWLASVRYAPSENIKVDYKLAHSEGYDVNKAIQVLDDSAIAFLPFVGVVKGPTYVSGPKRLDAVNNEMTGPSFRNSTMHSLIASLKVSDALSFKNILAYGDSRQGQNGSELTGAGGLRTDDSGVCNLVFPSCTSAAGAPFKLVGVTGTRESRQLQEELQIDYRSPVVDLTGGVFYFDEKAGATDAAGFVYVFETLPNPIKAVNGVPCGASTPAFSDPCPSPRTDDNRNRSTAVYAHAAWHVSDRVDVLTGARQTWDDRKGVDVVFDTYTPFATKKNKLDWLVGVTFKLDDSTLMWAKASTAFLSGGRAGGLDFEPEEMTQYELGAKVDFFDRRLRLNTSLFYSDYKNLQFSYFDPNTGVGQFLNAGKATIYGAELELSAIPVDGLTVALNLGVTDFKYDKVLQPAPGDSFPFDGLIDVTDTFVVANRPKATGFVMAEYAFAPMASGAHVALRVDGSYRSSSENRNGDLGITPDGVDLNALTRTKSAFLLNARATLADVSFGGSSRLSVSAWGRNLTNEIRVYGNSIVVTNGVFSEPRTYGLDITMEF